MKIVKNLFGEDVPKYDSSAEQMAAIKAYLGGDYGKLTILEIEYFRNLEKDPYMTKFAAEHAGQVANDVDPGYLAGMRFVFGDDILDVPHPITNYYLYQLERSLEDESAV